MKNPYVNYSWTYLELCDGAGDLFLGHDQGESRVLWMPWPCDDELLWYVRYVLLKMSRCPMLFWLNTFKYMIPDWYHTIYANTRDHIRSDVDVHVMCLCTDVFFFAIKCPLGHFPMITIPKWPKLVSNWPKNHQPMRSSSRNHDLLVLPPFYSHKSHPNLHRLFKVPLRLESWLPNASGEWSISMWCLVLVPFNSYSQWIGLGENLQENPMFNGKIYGFL